MFYVCLLRIQAHFRKFKNKHPLLLGDKRSTFNVNVYFESLFPPPPAPFFLRLREHKKHFVSVEGGVDRRERGRRIEPKLDWPGRFICTAAPAAGRVLGARGEDRGAGERTGSKTDIPFRLGCSGTPGGGTGHACFLSFPLLCVDGGDAPRSKRRIPSARDTPHHSPATEREPMLPW